jgi:hypothetical protein
MQTTAQNASCDALTGDDTQQQERGDGLPALERAGAAPGGRVIDPTGSACVFYALN